MIIEAIVIKKTAAREHDQLVTLYCRQLGKTLAIAKSIFKPHSTQALALDEGNLIHCELVSGKSTPIITGAQAVRCISSAKSSAPRWAAAQFFLQVIDAAAYDNQEDDQLFACLADTLTELDQAGDDQVLSIFRRRQDELLATLGYGRMEPTVVASVGQGRTEMDDAYERIAQRRLATIDFFYDIVRNYARRV